MRVNPIINWSHKQVWNYLLHNKISYCTLYDKGYSYIGSKKKTKRNINLKK